MKGGTLPSPPGAVRPEPLFLDFFYLLRQNDVPVSTREWLMFVECLAMGLCAADLHRFYALARATLVKSEKHYDIFDRCFAHYFAGAEPPVGLAKALEQWLDQPIPAPQLTPEELAMLTRHDPEELRRMFEERMREQNERHDGGNKWIGTGGHQPVRARRPESSRNPGGWQRRRAQRPPDRQRATVSRVPQRPDPGRAPAGGGPAPAAAPGA